MLFAEIVFERRLVVVEGRGVRDVSQSEADELITQGEILAEEDTNGFFADLNLLPRVQTGPVAPFGGLPDLIQSLSGDWVRVTVADPGVFTPPADIDPDELLWPYALRASADHYNAVTYGCSGDEVLGAAALSIVVPDLTHLPWGAIAEFRDHPGSHEARHRLRDFDANARLGEFDICDRQRFDRLVAHEITRSLMAAWRETRPKIKIELPKEAALTGIGFVPLVGPALSLGASLGDTQLHAQRHARSWISALWNLLDTAQ